jgi:hypothetical protein
VYSIGYLESFFGEYCLLLVGLNFFVELQQVTKVNKQYPAETLDYHNIFWIPGWSSSRSSQQQWKNAAAVL